MEIPAPDPSKLLQSWMEWERGDLTPGRVMANLKTGGLRILLEGLVAATDAPKPQPLAPTGEAAPAGEGGPLSETPPTWVPAV
jgi:hypothetical protein